MSINLGGYSANSKLEVEANTLAAKVVLRPSDWSPYPSAPGGSYSRKLYSGFVMGAGFSGSTFQFRWTNAALNCGVRRVLYQMGSTSASAATAGTISLFATRLFSAAGALGTSFSGANSDGKRRNTQEPTLVGDMRIGPTSGNAVLTAGTWAQDADPLAAAAMTWPTVNDGFGRQAFDGLGTSKLYPLWETLPGEQPIVLAAQEGLNVNFTISPANNNYVIGVRIEWDELPLI